MFVGLQAIWVFKTHTSNQPPLPLTHSPISDPPPKRTNTRVPWQVSLTRTTETRNSKTVFLAKGQMTRMAPDRGIDNQDHQATLSGHDLRWDSAGRTGLI